MHLPKLPTSPAPIHRDVLSFTGHKELPGDFTSLKPFHISACLYGLTTWRPGNGQTILEAGISHEGIWSCSLLHFVFKEEQFRDLPCQYFPAVFDRSAVQWDIDLCCGGYQSVHATTESEQDDETYWMWGQATELLWVLGPQSGGFDDFWLN